MNRTFATMRHRNTAFSIMVVFSMWAGAKYFVALANHHDNFDSFHLIFTSRVNPVNNDHLGMLFRGDRPTDPVQPKTDNTGWIQFMPLFAEMSDHQPSQHHICRSRESRRAPGILFPGG
jgi:hypothetical protein